MDIFWQAAALVSEPSGSLVYHLVLLFALGIAAAVAIGRWSRARHAAGAHVALAATALFVLRLASLVVAILTALSVLDRLIVLPPFDRAVSTLSLLLIFWILAFPEPNRLIDAVVALLGVLILLALAISWGLWAQEARAAGFYNGSLQETAWETTQILMIATGLVVVLLRRRPDWGLGVALVGVLAAGHIVHYLAPIAQTSVAGAERLAEIVALPMLVALLYRRAPDAQAAGAGAPAWTTLVEPPVKEDDTQPRRAAAAFDPKAALALAALSTAPDEEQLGQLMTVAVAQAVQAPLSLLLAPSGDAPAGGWSVTSAFALAGELDLPANFRVLDDQPELVAVLQRGEAGAWYPTPAASPLQELAVAAGLPTAAMVWLMPLQPPDGPLLGLVPPVKPADWLTQQQPLLQGLVAPLAATWSGLTRQAQQARALEQAQAALGAAQQDLQRSREVNDSLTNQLQLQRRAETVQTKQLQELEELRALETQVHAAQAEAEQRQEIEQQLRSELEQARAEVRTLMTAREPIEADLRRSQAELADARGQLQAAAIPAEQKTQLQAALDQATAALEQTREQARLAAAALEQKQQLVSELQSARAEDLAQLDRLRLQAPAEGPVAQQLAADVEPGPSALQAALAQAAAAGEALAAAEARLAGRDLELSQLRQDLQDSEAQRAAALVAPAQAAPGPDLEVIASISQELRQPMSSIVGYADLLLSESVGLIGALQRKFLERIKASSERIGVLLDDLMRVMAIDSGNLRLAHESVDVVRVIEDALHSCETLYHEKNLKLICNIPSNLPALQADRDAVLQIFTHLLNNSGAASANETEVKLTVQCESDQRPGAAKVDYLVISVADSGGGIAPEDQPRVFSRLYRAEAPLIAGLGDNGMGLSIAKALVEGHGGRIWVMSELGVGSTFYVVLPLEGKHARSNGTPGNR